MIERLNPPTVRPVPRDFAGIYAHAVALHRPERLVCIAGQIGVSGDGKTDDDFEGQCHRAMDNVEAILDAAGLVAGDIVRVVFYVTDPADLPTLTEIRRQRWHSAEPPAVTTLVVAGLAAPELRVEIEIMAGR